MGQRWFGGTAVYYNLGDSMNRITMETVRAIVRPLLTLSGWAVFLYIVLKRNDTTITALFIEMISMLVSFWFGQRSGKEK